MHYLTFEGMFIPISNEKFIKCNAKLSTLKRVTDEL